MFFAKNEVIELAHGKKHIVLDTTKYEGKYYYYVVEITEDEKNITISFRQNPRHNNRRGYGRYHKQAYR